MLQVSVPRLYKMVFFMSIIRHASCISFCDFFNSSSCIIIHHHSPSLIIMHHDLSSFIIMCHHYHVFIMMMFFHHNALMYTSHNFTIIRKPQAPRSPRSRKVTGCGAGATEARRETWKHKFRQRKYLPPQRFPLKLDMCNLKITISR